MPDTASPLDLLTDHAEEASFLWLQRSEAVCAPHYDRQQFADLDERLAANLDGLQTAGDGGWQLAEEGLVNDGPEDYFVAGVLALLTGGSRFNAIVDRLAGTPEAMPGVASALGWVPSRHLVGRVAALLDSPDPQRQRLGIAACALHRRDPGSALAVKLEAAAGGVRCRAARAAGELGRVDLLPGLAALREAGSPESRYWAARAARLLGDASALDVLQAISLAPGPRQQPALELALLGLEPKPGHDLLRQTAHLPAAGRPRVIGAGLVGDAAYVPWLIETMADPALARIAGEAFVHITGADFNLDQLEAMPPEGHEDGPTDDPEDDDVELPEDIALPWPDVERVKAWWLEHRSDFTPGRKLFLGKPVTPEHCVHVLKTGLQRQRVIAAQYRTLIAPGTVLFPTSAPAWRQQKLLDAM